MSTFFHLKIIVFTAVKNCIISNRRIIVMFLCCFFVVVNFIEIFLFSVHKYDVTNTKTPAPTTAALTKSTMSICDYLCSVQRGGAACKCSSPVLPGR